MKITKLVGPACLMWSHFLLVSFQFCRHGGNYYLTPQMLWIHIWKINGFLSIWGRGESINNLHTSNTHSSIHLRKTPHQTFEKQSPKMNIVFKWYVIPSSACHTQYAHFDFNQISDQLQSDFRWNQNCLFASQKYYHFLMEEGLMWLKHHAYGMAMKKGTHPYLRNCLIWQNIFQRFDVAHVGF